MDDKTFFKKLQGILEAGWVDIPEGQGYGGTGGPGLMLEALLGLSKSKHDGPDTGIWELKYHGGNSPLTLFHLTPEPKGIMQKMVREHGWPDGKGRISFRHTIWGCSPKGFRVCSEDEKVFVKNDRVEAALPYWRHDALINAFVYKLRRLAVIHGQKWKGQVRYDAARLHWEPNISGFIQAICAGMIAIDFDARTNLTGIGLRDHGTKFRIKVEDLKALYLSSRIFE